jgi:sorbitol-specific phosphotransferase system component IIC
MIDRYVKVVLTVIATALVCLVAQNAITSLHAQQGIQRVAICSAANELLCVGIGPWGGKNNYLPTGPASDKP